MKPLLYLFCDAVHIKLKSILLVGFGLLFFISCSGQAPVSPDGDPTWSWTWLTPVLVALYELVARLAPTKSKWWSIVEIIYKVISAVIPNRATSRK